MSKVTEGWSRNRGRKCPVESGTLVDLQLRGGVIHIGKFCDNHTWIHTGEPFDVMYYRLHKPAEQVTGTSCMTDLLKGDQKTVNVVMTCGPLQWRDRIKEIDATTQALTTERAELVQKLASDGFALIVNEPDAPIGLPREEWKIGDLVVLSEKTGKTSMPTGVPLPITFFDGSSDGQDVKVDDFYYPPVCDLVWHSRPST